MPDTINASQDDLPIAITVADSALSRQQRTIAGGSGITSGLDAAISDDALVFSEIDRLLVAACAMAQYYERNSVGAAIVLAMRINKMDYDGRRFELFGREE